MIDILADGVVPFSIALALMFFIGVLEIASFTFGLSVGAIIDDLLPDFEVEYEVEHPGHMGPLAHLFSWLSIGKVPFMVLLVIFLVCFGLAGYMVQILSIQVFGAMISGWMACVPALFLGFLGMSRIGSLVAGIIPKDQSNAASRKDLLGAVGKVVRGAKYGTPAEAKALDLSARIHYFLIEPDQEGVDLERDDEILVVRLKEGSPIYVGTKLSPKDMEG